LKKSPTAREEDSVVGIVGEQLFIEPSFCGSTDPPPADQLAGRTGHGNAVVSLGAHTKL